MPTKKPSPTTKQPRRPTTNGVVLTGEVFTLAEAAAFLKLPEAEVVRCVHELGLPAKQVGAEWRFLKVAIQQWLSTTAPTPQSRKEAQLALAGKFKDDEELPRICEEAYRQRGRPMTEED